MPTCRPGSIQSRRNRVFRQHSECLARSLRLRSRGRSLAHPPYLLQTGAGRARGVVCPGGGAVPAEERRADGRAQHHKYAVCRGSPEPPCLLPTPRERCPAPPAG
ncbi:hypothetical protein KIL84_023236 [Mauremys mutica]|uniref:Uncharacterized protein n=1 Tax=Mauremys mutica TaxID=74926 RepID=A0A9D3WR65_9SAUR|nr:hypothetical protein KIL84_023236 [Mauremys mutica]